MKRISVLAYVMFLISAAFAVIRILSLCALGDSIIAEANIPTIVWFALFGETAVIGVVAIVFVAIHIKDSAKKKKSPYAHKY
jgi:hypothetical protein